MQTTHLSNFRGFLNPGIPRSKEQTEVICSLLRMGSLSIDLVAEGVRESHFTEILRKQNHLPSVFLPVKATQLPLSGVFRLESVIGTSSMRSEIDSLLAQRKYLSKTDIKALFALFLYSYAEMEKSLQFDTLPSLERIFIFDGKLTFLNPCCYSGHIKVLDSVCLSHAGHYSENQRSRDERGLLVQRNGDKSCFERKFGQKQF